MALTKDQKQKLLSGYQRKQNDSGSSEVQIALLTERINTLTDHFKTHVKDNHSRYGLIKLVNKRRRLLDYIRSRSQERYQDILTRLNLRK